MSEHRRAYITIDGSVLVELMKFGTRNRDGLIFDGLPKDATFASVHPQGGGKFFLLIESATFEDVPVGGTYPEFVGAVTYLNK